MLVKIVPHDTIQHLFSSEQESYEVSLDKYDDIFSYLSNMHPKFSEWSKNLEKQSDITILDKNGDVLNSEKFICKITDENEVLYIVPMFSGGKGRIGKFVTGALILAAVYYTGGFAWTVKSGLVFSGAIAKTAFWVGVAFIAQSLIREDDNNNSSDPDGGTRQNNLFGSLKATQGQGVYIPQAYGQVRVVGHMLSGYIDHHKHGTGDIVKLSDIYNLPKSSTTKNTGDI